MIQIVWTDLFRIPYIIEGNKIDILFPSIIFPYGFNAITSVS